MATRPSETKRDANLELARDLVSLSVDGGLLIFGVRDKDFRVVGCDTASLRDRISQVVSSRIHPPLSLGGFTLLPHPHDDCHQVMVVQVPPSPLAPHMVDGSYWGRSSNGKRKLDNAEVRRLLSQRDRGEDAFRERLIGMEERDPLASYVEGYPTGHGHIYLVADPGAPLVRNGERQGSDVLRDGIQASQRSGTIRDCKYPSNDPTGESYATMPALGELQPSRYEQNVCHVVLKDDASIEIVSGGGPAECAIRTEVSRKILRAGLVSTLVVQTLQLVRGRSLAWGYSGLWRVGLRVTQTRGAF